MARKYLHFEEMVQEINRLENSPHVAIARTAEKLEVSLRQYMAELQRLEEKGIALEKAGITETWMEAVADFGFDEI